MSNNPRFVGLRRRVDAIPLPLLRLTAQHLFDGCLVFLVLLVYGFLELGGEESSSHPRGVSHHLLCVLLAVFVPKIELLESYGLRILDPTSASGSVDVGGVPIFEFL